MISESGSNTSSVLRCVIGDLRSSVQELALAGLVFNHSLALEAVSGLMKARV